MEGGRGEGGGREGDGNHNKVNMLSRSARCCNDVISMHVAEPKWSPMYQSEPPPSLSIPLSLFLSLSLSLSLSGRPFPEPPPHALAL